MQQRREQWEDETYKERLYMDNDIVQYHYDELIKSLVTLASPAEKQKYIMGYGHVGDDMIIEFESHYNLGMTEGFSQTTNYRN